MFVRVASAVVLLLAIVVNAASINRLLNDLSDLHDEGKLSDAQYAKVAAIVGNAKREHVAREVTPGCGRSETTVGDLFVVSKKEIGEIVSKAVKRRDNDILEKVMEIVEDHKGLHGSNPITPPAQGSPASPRRHLQTSSENAASAAGSTTQLHLKAPDGKIALGPIAARQKNSLQRSFIIMLLMLIFRVACSA